jgi:hypothetical protein
MIKNLLSLLLFLLTGVILQAQQIHFLSSGKSVSLRGLSVVSERIIWVSGSGGTVGLSINGGNSWTWYQVPRYEKTDFRDIEGFSSREAVIMGVTEPAVILRTTDGGKTWTTAFEDSSKNLFLDAMDFSGDEGVIIGDPSQGSLFFAETKDRGRSWNKKYPSGFEKMAEGETFFAASGSNIGKTGPHQWVLVSGGTKACLYVSEGYPVQRGRYPLLLNQGKESAGANSITIHPSDRNRAFVTGGDFSNNSESVQNSLLIHFNPFRQEAPLVPPHGYRSAVIYINDLEMVCCGISGVDLSTDGGLHWSLISSESFHVCGKAKKGKGVFLAGTNGRIARLDWKEENPK